MTNHSHSGHVFGPDSVIEVMRQTLRDQAAPTWTDRHKAISRFINENDLLRLTLWPGWVISLTPAGAAYIAEHGSVDPDD